MQRPLFCDLVGSSVAGAGRSSSQVRVSWPRAGCVFAADFGMRGDNGVSDSVTIFGKNLSRALVACDYQ